MCVSEDDAIDMPLVPVSRQEPSTVQESSDSIASTPNAQITLVSCPVSPPRKMMNDISENPSWSPLSCPVPIPRMSITVPFNIHVTLILPQESVLPRHYRHERPIAIVRPVLMLQIKSMDNSQGKCGRYKVKLRLNAHWSNVLWLCPVY